MSITLEPIAVNEKRQISWAGRDFGEAEEAGERREPLGIRKTAQTGPSHNPCRCGAPLSGTRSRIHPHEAQGVAGRNKNLQLRLGVQHAGIADVIIRRGLIQQPVYLPLNGTPADQVVVSRCGLRLQRGPCGLDRRSSNVGS